MGKQYKTVKNVSNLLQNIGTCRDLLEEKDFKKIKNKIGLFDRTYGEVCRNINRYMFNRKTTLDFTPDDSKELASEIKNYLEKDFPIEFSYEGFLKVLDEIQQGEVNNTIIKDFVTRITEYLYVDTKLREAMKILTYTAVLHRIWQINYEKYENEEDIMFQITEAMKGCLK